MKNFLSGLLAFLLTSFVLFGSVLVTIEGGEKLFAKEYQESIENSSRMYSAEELADKYRSEMTFCATKVALIYVIAIYIISCIFLSILSCLENKYNANPLCDAFCYAGISALICAFTVILIHITNSPLIRIIEEIY